MATKKKTAIDQIMEKSGNVFHSRVVKLLRDQKWSVLVSPYYSDNFTDKPREIDIIAGKSFEVNNFNNDPFGTIYVRLFVECKYITGKTIFWFDDKDKNRAIERIMIDTGMDHPTHNINIEKLHYFKESLVAKLFSSEKNRSEDNEPISKAINQNLNALIYYRNRTSLFSEDQNAYNKVLRRVTYPIIIVNSFENFFRTSMTDKIEKVEQITEPFQLEVNYAYIDKDKSGCNEYFLIDVVSINKLEDFFSMLEKTDILEITEKVRFEERTKKVQKQNSNKGGNNPAM